jgi:hypothetical protein
MADLQKAAAVIPSRPPLSSRQFLQDQQKSGSGRIHNEEVTDADARTAGT